MIKNRLNCIDLFAGAGGLSLAAIECGFNVAAAIEINRYACMTYRTNILKKSAGALYENNILDVNPKDILDRHFADGNSCDVVLGGPPCQGFSVHRIKNAGVDDPRNALILRYFEYVSVLRPKVFLMENVPGLLWPRHRKFLDAFYEEAARAGYKVLEPKILDARDYGLPQRRKRVFVLGIRENIRFNTDWPPPETHGNEKARIQKPHLKPWETAQAIFETPVLPDDKNDIHMQHTQALVEVFKATRKNRHDSGRVLPCHEKHNGHSDVYGRIDPSQPGPTMTTACINPSKGRFVHPTEHHGITVRQAARFQTFPDDFVFEGGLMAAGEQIGNAVPVKLGEILLRTVAEGLQSHSNEQPITKP